MITSYTIKAQRQHVQCVDTFFFNYIALLQRSEMINLQNSSKVSTEYLTIKLIHSLLSEIQLLIKKRLINSQAHTLTLKLTQAQAITLYKTFLNLPVETNDIYFFTIRNNWIEILDQQIFK